MATKITINDLTHRHSRSILAGYVPEVLFGSTVLVAGAGALGQNVLQNLALAGVGKLIIVDYDRFEPHNATRSPLFPSSTEVAKLGAGKALTVAHRLAGMATAPEARVYHFDGFIQELDADVVTESDLIISAVDSQAARAYLSELARVFETPIIEGGFAAEQFSMMLDPADWAAACYRCSNPQSSGSFSCTQYALAAERDAVIPAIQNAAAVLAGLMSEAAVMSLHGAEITATYNKLVGDIRAGQLLRTVVGRHERCPGVHGELVIRQTLTLDSWTFGALRLALQGMGLEGFRLLEPFVVEMSCRRCGNRLRPLTPQSTWQKLALCQVCDPASVYAPIEGIFIPLEYQQFTLADIEALDLEQISLEQAGLGEGSRLLGVAAADAFTVIRLEHAGEGPEATGLPVLANGGRT